MEKLNLVKAELEWEGKFLRNSLCLKNDNVKPKLLPGRKPILQIAERPILQKLKVIGLKMNPDIKLWFKPMVPEMQRQMYHTWPIKQITKQIPHWPKIADSLHNQICHILIQFAKFHRNL